MEHKAAKNGGDPIDRPAMSAHGSARELSPRDDSLTWTRRARCVNCSATRPRRPDLLIEFLHLIQDRYHYLSARHLRALCEEMRLPQAAVYEVATFYSHFDVVKEGETPPPPTTIRVCNSITCELKGAEALLAALKAHEPVRGARAARALHGPLRYRASLRGRTSPRRSRHVRIRRGGGWQAASASRDSALSESRRVSGGTAAIRCSRAAAGRAAFDAVDRE